MVERKLWSECKIPTGQVADIVGIFQDKIGGDIKYLCRYTAGAVQRDDWFDENVMADH